MGITRARRKADNRPFFVGFTAAFLFFCASGYVFYTKIIEIQHDVSWVTHTHEVLLSTKSIMSYMKDAETGQRGYVITGNPDYLEPYRAALTKIPQAVNDLEKRTSDNAQQQQRIDEIREKISQKIERLDSTISLRRNQDVEGAMAAVGSGEGKELMDDLRNLTSAIEQTEAALRQQRLQALDNTYKVAIITGFLTAAAGVLLAFAVTMLLQRAAEQRASEKWLQEGKFGLSNAMLGDLTVSELGRNVLKFLAEYLNAQAGIFFALEDQRYRRAATYGFPSQDEAYEYINDNDDLLGQAIQDGKAFIVVDIPDDYLKVGSGLGQSKPRNLVISPAICEGTVNAVFELGFMQDLDEDMLTLLNQVKDIVGVAVQSAHYRNHLQKLLEETQAQAEELQTQSEELRVSNEELEEQSVALKESQARLEQQQEELEASNEELEEQNMRIRQQTQDIDENRRQLQVKASELEQSSKYKSEFLANMSHELRTPLNSLLILSKNLAGNDEGNLTAEQIEESQIIYNGGLELLNLINDILDLSKVEAGKLNIIANNTEIHDIARRMEQQFNPVANEAALHFTIRVADDLPDIIHTDAQRVEQILKNLLSNAFKFTKDGSVTLDIRRPDDRITLQRENLAQGTAIAFTVTDTGIGIDETKLQSIFEAFQQEDGSTDRHYGGTGLGLTIARKLAQILGGEIHVTSRKGEGSTFTLTLPEQWVAADGAVSVATREVVSHFVPFQMTPAPVPSDLPGQESAGKKDKTLLVIEDDHNFAKILANIAQKNGYKTLIAGDGKTGILMATEQAVSAIILDLNLPDIGGLNVLEQLKHDLRTRHVPIHIITGMEDTDSIAPLRKGAVGFLTKPAAVEDIDAAFRKIEGVLDSSIKKILVVEDDRKSQVAIQSLLKKKDIAITCVGTGNAALKHLSEEKFDCIILDLTLPDMTGFEWLSNVSEQGDSDDLPPIIVYTARELTEEENSRLNHYTGSIVIKGVHSSERLLDEVTLFLHSVESSLSKDQQAMIRMQHNPDKVLQDRTILLVDDDLRNTFALSKMLKKHGINVIIADNGQMALDRLGQVKEIELVIMDIMMPVMDGYQAIQKIRQNNSWKKLPVIALTARAMPEEQEKCMECGANDYMTKPVDLDHLLTLMRVWLFKQEEIS